MDAFELEGNVEIFNQYEVSGWARYKEINLVVALQVRIAGSVVANIIADKFREDLRQVRPDSRFAFHVRFTPGVTALLEQAGASMVDIVEGTGSARHLNGRQFARYTLPSSQISDSPTIVSGFESSPENSGLWIDRPDWIRKLGQKHRRGEISDELAVQIFHFVRDGYIILRSAVDHSLLESVNRDVEDFWANPPDGLVVETFEPDSVLKIVPPLIDYRSGRTKMLDLYAHSAAARQAISNGPAIDFLSAIFDEAPKAFQSLNFWLGSGQPMHKDSAYVKIDTNPTAFAATWIALEDITVGTGELEYYVGSHHAPDFLFGGKAKWMEAYPADHDKFLQSLHDDAKIYNQPRRSFVANAGDVLIWHADLAHGGTPVTRVGQTRKSLVTHFTARSLSPFFYRNSTNKELEVNRCLFSSQYSDVD